jgi:hypothetical protein
MNEKENKTVENNRYYQLRTIFEFLGGFSILKQIYVYVSIVLAAICVYVGLGQDPTFIQTLLISDITLFGFTITAFSILLSLQNHTADYLKNILRVPEYIYSIGQFTWTEILLFAGFSFGSITYAMITDSFGVTQLPIRGVTIFIDLTNTLSYPFYFFSLYGILNTFVWATNVLRHIAITRGRADDELKAAWDEGMTRLKK